MENQIREIYKDDFTEYLLCLALDVGEGMLKNGAEVSRVEDTIERICRAYGAVHVEVFTIISMINAAIRMPDGSYSSQLRRVKQTYNNLNVLERLNDISRRICKDKPSLDEFDGMLRDLKKEKPYKPVVCMFSAAVATSAFCLFFGGGVIDAVITFFVGMAMSLILDYPSTRLNSMAKTVIAAFFATTVAGLAYKFIPGADVDSIIIGSIMLLVPGILFGTAMRDLLCGDLIAGTLKILQAIIQTLMIGFGYMLSYALIGDILIPEVGDGEKDLFLIQIVASFVTSIAFSIIFKINKRHLINAGIAGVLTYAAYFGVFTLTASLFWAAFISSAVTALFAEVNARISRAPSIVMLIPGVIPIVPGGYLYRSVRNYICGMTPSAMVELTTAGAIALGMAGGIVSLTIIYGLVSDYVLLRAKNGSIKKTLKK